ncbi:hypothetical protein AB0G04_13875 [Actinoplanes sp. NPDC023801]|uniref:hypothetical protein n=1 Tax=Actinoplanes sp. NPDC023801 TaxID=3154595 RepID=UPI0033FF9C6B
MRYPMHEIDLETPEGDAAEQATMIPGWQDDEPDDQPPVSDANEWDAQEQNRIVGFDDDYR